MQDRRVQKREFFSLFLYDSKYLKILYFGERQ